MRELGMNQGAQVEGQAHYSLNHHFSPDMTHTDSQYIWVII